MPVQDPREGEGQGVSVTKSSLESVLLKVPYCVICIKIWCSEAYRNIQPELYKVRLRTDLVF